MHPGLFFLWVLSLGASLGAGCYVQWVFRRDGRFENRRQVNGYELARQVLDRNHLSQAAIEEGLKGSEPFSDHAGERLFLCEKIYRGTKLADLAVSLHETISFMDASQSLLPLSSFLKKGKFFQTVMIGSWILILSGIFFPALRGLASLGQGLFVAAFLTAALCLGKETELMERSFSNLMALEGLATDEMARMKRLLKALLWNPWAAPWEAPLIFFKNRGKTSRKCLTKI